MRPVTIKSINYKDGLALERRRRFVFWVSMGLIALAAILGGTGYLLFFSKAFDIREVTLVGLKTLDYSNLQAEIQSIVESKKFKYIQLRKNILFFDDEALKNKFLSENPVLSGVEIKKKYRHGIEVNFNERTAVGIWCFGDKGCRYFDDEGVSWGDAIKSSGFLFTVINDLRGGDSATIDKEFLEGITKAIAGVKGLGFTIKESSIPNGSVNDFHLSTEKGYNLMFSFDSNIDEQVAVLKIFLDNKPKDGSFKPQYIDLRIDGREYYK